MKQFQCSMSKKKESLGKKSEGYEISSYRGGQPSIWIYGDDPVIGDDLTIDVVNGNYDFGELKLKPGETILNVTDEEDLDDLLENELAGVIKLVDWVPGDFRNGSNKYPLVKVLVKEAKKPESKKNERGTTKIETYVGFDELLGYADAEYLFEDIVDVLSKYYTYEGEGDDIVFDEDPAKDDPEFTIKIEGGDERADFYSEDIFYVHLPNKEAAEELAKVLGGELSESKKPESCKDGKKESMERCDSCGAVMTEYDYDRYGGLCKRCRDKGEAKKSEGLSEYRHYTNPDNGRTASLDPIKHPGLNKFIVYFGAGEKQYSSIKDAEDDLKSRGYEKDESKKSEADIDKSKREFDIAFKTGKDTVFEIDYYRCGSNDEPYFSTAASIYYPNHRGSRGGQCQDDALKDNKVFYDFYKKWNPKHLHKLTDAELDELETDIEALKKAGYPYVEAEDGDWENRVSRRSSELIRQKLPRSLQDSPIAQKIEAMMLPKSSMQKKKESLAKKSESAGNTINAHLRAAPGNSGGYKMLEPDNQKVYFTSEDLSDLYPEAEDPMDAALNVLEGEQSFIVVDGKELPLGYDAEKDAIIIEDSEVSSKITAKARQLMQLFVENELFTTREIEGQNGFMPDEDYPYSVNIADGQSYGVASYYPSEEMIYPTEVNIWSGSGYTTSSIYVDADPMDAQGALEEAVAIADKRGWTGILLDVAETEQAMADDGHFNLETGEGDAIFEETYMYVDATMEGASQPYYIYAENLGVVPNENLKIK